MTEALRSEVRRRANSCCEYCFAQESLSHDPFSAEHIISRLEEMGISKSEIIIGFHSADVRWISEFAVM